MPPSGLFHVCAVRFDVSDKRFQVLGREILLSDDGDLRVRSHPDRFEVLGRVDLRLGNSAAAATCDPMPAPGSV